MHSDRTLPDLLEDCCIAAPQPTHEITLSAIWGKRCHSKYEHSALWERLTVQIVLYINNCFGLWPHSAQRANNANSHLTATTHPAMYSTHNENAEKTSADSARYTSFQLKTCNRGVVKETGSIRKVLTYILKEDFSALHKCHPSIHCAHFSFRGLRGTLSFHLLIMDLCSDVPVHTLTSASLSSEPL